MWHGVEVFCGPRGLKETRPVYYHNRGDGSFEDATAAAGFLASKPSYGLGVTVFDLDRDGLPDIYVANDARANFVWHNLGNDRFEETALARGAGLSDNGKEQAGMGVDAGDYDNDGWPDLFVTNFSEDSYALYHNEHGLFSDASQFVGITEATFTPLGWGTKFLDFDNDGDLDIVAVNGHVYPQVDSVICRHPSPGASARTCWRTALRASSTSRPRPGRASSAPIRLAPRRSPTTTTMAGWTC